MSGLFFQLGEIEKEGSTLTAMQREMLFMTLEANPGIALGPALTDVFDYLNIKVKKPRLEAIGQRLHREHMEREREAEEQAAEAQSKAPKKEGKSEFGASLVKWLGDMHAGDKLLAALHYDADKAREIYCNQDFLVCDTICKIFLEHTWQLSQITLEAAAAPWSGGGKNTGKGGGPVEAYDMTQESDDSPLWDELGSLFNKRS